MLGLYKVSNVSLGKKNQTYLMMMLEKDMNIFVLDVQKNKLLKKFLIIKM